MDIHSAHLGHGLCVYNVDITDPETRDYQKLAFIYPNRDVVFYIDLNTKDRQTIIDIAKLDDREVSITQDKKVFIERPDPFRVIKTIDKIRKYAR